jgi:hypothetical protein
MLALASVFLLSLVVSLIAILIYRLVLSLHSYVQSQVDKPRSVSWMKLVTQQGFGSFLSAPKEQAKVARLSRSKDDIKKPWGW